VIIAVHDLGIQLQLRPSNRPQPRNLSKENPFEREVSSRHPAFTCAFFPEDRFVDFKGFKPE